MYITHDLAAVFKYIMLSRFYVIFNCDPTAIHKISEIMCVEGKYKRNDTIWQLAFYSSRCNFKWMSITVN